MIQNALTGEINAAPKTLPQQESDFTAEGSPPPGYTDGSHLPSSDGTVVPEPVASVVREAAASD